MPIEISEVHAMQDGSIFPKAKFFDEDKKAVVPTTVSWTWTDEDGEVINSRQDVVETPAHEIKVALFGDDLALPAAFAGDAAARILTISATYTSDKGAGMPLIESLKIFVDRRVKATT